MPVRNVAHSVLLMTRKQLVLMLAAWGIKANPPRKGRYLRLDFPGQLANRGAVSVYGRPSTCGETLFRVQLWSRELVRARLAGVRSQTSI